MAQAYHVSQAGFELVKRFEGFQASPLALPDGWWLSGFNHASQEQADLALTPAVAEALLRQDLREIEDRLNDHVFIPLTQEQFDALVSFAFSIGWEAFRVSDVLQLLNAGALIAAADSLLEWRYGAVGGAPGLLSVLARRRAIEAAWLLEEGVHRPIASKWVQPRPSPHTASPAHALVDAPAQRPGEAGKEAQPAAQDAMTLRLREILAAEPASARALLPPIVHEEMEDELPLEGPFLLGAPVRGPSWLDVLVKDHVALGAFAVMGAVLVGVGLGLMPGTTGFAKALAGVLFAVPGGLVSGGALFFLFREGLQARKAA